MRATPDYRPGERTPAPPCRLDENGQVVRIMLDKHEKQRAKFLERNPAPYTKRFADGLVIHRFAFIGGLDDAEERIRRMAARP